MAVYEREREKRERDRERDRETEIQVSAGARTDTIQSISPRPAQMSANLQTYKLSPTSKPSSMDTQELLSGSTIPGHYVTRFVAASHAH